MANKIKWSDAGWVIELDHNRHGTVERRITGMVRGEDKLFPGGLGELYGQQWYRFELQEHEEELRFVDGTQAIRDRSYFPPCFIPDYQI